MKKYTERDVYNSLYLKIFNTDVYEVFPELERCIKEDYNTVTGFLEDFLIDLFDLSKPVVKPFLDERSTYVYRTFYGIGNFGLGCSKADIGRQLSLTGERIGQIIRNTDIALINMIIYEYKAYKSNQEPAEIMIEELNLPRRVYNTLKRCGINTINDIDFDYLDRLQGFGDKSLMSLEEGITKVRKK